MSVLTVIYNILIERERVSDTSLILTAEEAKNRHALERVTTILREAVWINTHFLPVSDSYWV